MITDTISPDANPTESTKCGICNGTCKLDVVSNGYTYYLCINCKSSHLSPKPSASDLMAYYDTFHLSKKAGGVYDDIENRMLEDFPTKVNLVISNCPMPNPRLLDVGCGKGYFVKAANAIGINAEGVDLSSSGIDFAVNTQGIKATQGSIQNIYLQNGWINSFDAISLWATIEHLPEPDTVLSAIYKCLKPGGLLFCDTGLRDVFAEKYLVGHNQWYDAPQHLFVYSEDGLTRLLRKAGFSITSCDRNFERSRLRRTVKYIRHTLISLISFFGIAGLLGSNSRAKAKLETKWPIGRLLMVVAKK